jgi:putative redox protein
MAQSSLKHSVNTVHKVGLSFEANIDQYQFGMDTTSDASVGGGPSPKKLMLAGLAGCTGIDIVSILEKMKVSFSDFHVNIEAELTEEHPQIYHTVNIIYTIKVSEEDQSKMERAVYLSKEKYCGVSDMFSHFAKLDFKIQFC